jgi:prepilin-type processing-associated H-X9-DG protein
MNFFFGGFGGHNATMGGGVGAWGSLYPIYLKTTDLITGQSPGPSMTWVFIDERPDSINWGNYLTDMDGDSPNMPSAYQWNQDMPGIYHNGGAGLAFADGHSEIQHWFDPRTRIPIPTTVSTGNYSGGGPAASPLTQEGNQDIRWMQLRTVRVYAGAE